MYNINTINKKTSKYRSTCKKYNFSKALLLLVLSALFIFSFLTLTPFAEKPAADSFNKATEDRVMLYPGGMPFGVRFNTRGLIVSGISHVMTEKGSLSPAEDSGLRTGDIIDSVNSKKVNTPEELTHEIKESGGKKIVLSILRCGKNKNLEITPEKSISDGSWRIGIFVRNECAGIGTVSYIDPENLHFAGLGHGICDQDSGELIPFLSGKATDAIISEVVKGLPGLPGELRGHLSGKFRGELSANLHTGIYGVLNELPDELYYPEPIPAAFKNEVHEGDAEILTTTDTNEICKYKISIEKVDLDNPKCKNFAIKITDESLIAKTGGIVQGMSGSPIIQDGKLVGAVTHVLVDDPACGYGIFIENMLKEAR